MRGDNPSDLTAPAFAPPLTCLPASSPRIATGRGAVIDGFANHQRCRKGAEAAVSLFLPVHGEKMPGRAMRGGASIDNC
ncbi:hypothetical protein MES4922_60155 [Mesorhizobium ventifaucium]|uniref:Propionyl-coenzyme A carboxylase alpha polypeptide n=1 Tax=Mesorhizobium ventifaucium TaxID=666020 RepID=A0ABM9ED90_9HYPH|nr:hypothetical protein MES4922_60155 [Mesorhizobium ventifaucium]